MISIPPVRARQENDLVDADLEQARYAHMRWNTPLSDAHAAVLLDRLEVGGGDLVVDLGCGWGELLMRAVAGSGDALGVGVDTAEGLLVRGRALAIARGLGSQVRFVHGAAEEWTESADRILCIGASHAWGGSERALFALAELLKPGGVLLFGDGCWERPPTGAAWGLFGGSVRPLAEIVEHAVAAGWRTRHLSTADQLEWDEFESTWRAGREDWVRAHADDPRAETARAELDARLAEYVGVYRGVLGFCYLILTR
jgi:cyclopropane fatty-acyl-phospholipid synthase-like methyltransferase